VEELFRKHGKSRPVELASHTERVDDDTNGEGETVPILDSQALTT
jgi:hypothetical protein